MKRALCCSLLFAVLFLASCKTCVECTLTEYCFTGTMQGDSYSYCDNNRDDLENLRDAFESVGGNAGSITSTVEDTEEYCSKEDVLVSAYTATQEAMDYNCVEQ